MDIHQITQLIQQQSDAKQRYFEFLRVPSMSMGLYTLPAGGTDPQQPHAEDEVYYVVQGRGSIQVADEDQEIEPGAIVFVGAQVEHRFHSITEALTLLVFFAPPESS